MNIEKIRSEIPALQHSIYLNTGGTGPMPTPVVDTLVEMTRYLEAQGPHLKPVQQTITEKSEAARQKLAHLLNVTPEEIAFTRCVADGLSMVAYGFDWSAGDEIIVTDQEHPTGFIPWVTLKDRYGVKLKRVALIEDKKELLSRFEKAISERTKLLALSHVTTENGFRLPAKEICELARERGIPVVYDGAQSVGQFSIDLSDIGCEFYAFASHKWLLGGLGAAAMYVRKDWIEKLKISWTGASAAHRTNYDEATFEPLETAKRFEYGGRNWPLYIAWGRAIDYLQEIGVKAIEERVQKLKGTFRAMLSEIPGVTLLSPEDLSLSTGIVAAGIPGIAPQEASDQLWEKWGIVTRSVRSVHPDIQGVRFSVAFFLTEEELERAARAVAEMAQEKSSP